jgi:predicted protein tyrosine phosphatase
MKINVMYRSQCLAAYLGCGPDFDVENIAEPTPIISISSTDDQIPLILKSGENKMVAHVEFLMFDDIDASELIGGSKPMSKNDAKRIVDAFLHYSDTVSQIIVHCDAGYSRSPAVAAALTKALGKSDDQYFGHGYCPNMHVYNTVLKELASRRLLK